MPYHYGDGSSDVEWWPENSEDGSNGSENRSEGTGTQSESRSSSPFSDDGWNYDTSAKGMYTQPALEASLRLSRDIAATTRDEWHEAVRSIGFLEDRSTNQTATPEETARFLHQHKFLDEIHRQVVNAISERDAAVTKAVSLEREVKLLCQDMIRLGEDLYSGSPTDPNFVRNVRRAATGLLQVGRDGSEGQERRERRKRRLEPVFQCQTFEGQR